VTVLLQDGAMDLSIDVGERLGVDDADLSPEAMGQIRTILRTLVRAWREELIQVWPVDTGRSQSSWSNRIEGLVWVLRNPVEYAEYVHVAGDPTQVWRYLETLSEELLDGVMTDLRAVVAESRREAQALGGQQRTLVGFAAQRPEVRNFGARLFRAAVEGFRDVSSRERTKRQLQRFTRAV
jgi:hypothetical protein